MKINPSRHASIAALARVVSQQNAAANANYDKALKTAKAELDKQALLESTSNVKAQVEVHADRHQNDVTITSSITLNPRKSKKLLACFNEWKTLRETKALPTNEAIIAKALRAERLKKEVDAIVASQHAELVKVAKSLSKP